MAEEKVRDARIDPRTCHTLQWENAHVNIFTILYFTIAISTGIVSRAREYSSSMIEIERLDSDPL